MPDTDESAMSEIPIEATQQKLKEAQFFLEHMDAESRRAGHDELRHDPKTFNYYLDAFLSAARSVTFTLQSEAKDKYKALWQPWLDLRSPEEQAWLNFFVEQRNTAEKRGRVETAVTSEYVPYTDVWTGGRGEPYSFFVSDPPGTPPPRVGIPVHRFDTPEGVQEVTAACRRYVELLGAFVRYFLAADEPEGGWPKSPKPRTVTVQLSRELCDQLQQYNLRTRPLGTAQRTLVEALTKFLDEAGV
jgi:hypothetical protein